MSGGYNFKNVLLSGASQAVAASQTGAVVSNVFGITDLDSLFFVCRVTCATQTVAAGITAKLQHSCDGGTTWVAVGTPGQVALTGASGKFTIDLNNSLAADAAVLPLYSVGRIVIDTGAGDSTTITEVLVSRRL